MADTTIERSNANCKPSATLHEKAFWSAELEQKKVGAAELACWPRRSADGRSDLESQAERRQVKQCKPIVRLFQQWHLFLFVDQASRVFALVLASS